MLQKVKIMKLKKVELQMMNTYLTFQSYNCKCTNSVFQEILWKKASKEKNHQIWKKTVVELKYSLVFLWWVQTNGYTEPCRKHLLTGLRWNYWKLFWRYTFNRFGNTFSMFILCYIETFSVLQGAVLTFTNYNKENCIF